MLEKNATAYGWLAKARLGVTASLLAGFLVLEAWCGAALVFAETLNRYPSGDIAVNYGTVFPAAPTTHFDKVDEAAADGAASYIQATGNGQKDVFSFSSFSVPAGATDISVSITYVAQKTGAQGASMTSLLRIGGVDYTGAAVDPANGVFTQYSDNWTTNPATGAAWTIAEVNGTDGTNPLQGIGVTVTDANPQSQVTQMYVSVSYWVNSPLLHNSTNTSSSRWVADGGWGIPAGKYGAFVCATCHARGTGNIKRIKTTLTAPNGVDPFPIEAAAGSISFLDVRDGTADFGDDSRADKTQSSHICEACHTYDVTKANGVEFHAYDMSGPGDPGHYNASNCMACHPHNQGFAPAGCDSCHGNPPTVNTLGGPNGLANSPFATGSATAGAHATHASTLGYGCGNCHSGYVMPQASTALPGQGDISISFSNFGSTAGSYTGQIGVSYNDVEGTGGTSCASVYCHGGTIGGSAASWVGSVACGDCHKATAVQMAGGAPGSHAQHAGNGAGQLNLACSKCHATPGSAGHVSGTVAWSLDTADGKFGASATYRSAANGVTAERAPSSSYGSCDSIYCHSPGQSSSGGPLAGGDYVAVAWGGTANCGSCHGAAGIASGSHAAHVTSPVGAAGCDACHTDAAADASSYVSANHINQLIDVVAGVTYTAGGAPGNGYGTCSASCHDTGRNSGGLTATWGTVLADCSDCHATVPATGSHATHVAVNFGGSAIACDACHTGTTEGTTAGPGHRDGNIDVSSGGYPADKALGTAFTTCSTATCHQSGAAANDYVVTSAWGTDDVNCTSCHAASPTTGSHTKHIATTNNCSDCHTDAVKDVSYDSTEHGDLNIDVAVGGYTANKVIGSAYQSCAAVTCHSDGMAATGDSPVWGDAGAGCAACHLSDMVTGSHAIHLADGALCGNCHGDTVKDNTAPSGVHANDNVDVYDVAAGDLGYPQVAAYGVASWSTCSSAGAAACHDDGTGTAATTPTWGTASADCSACHATIPATGSHAKHVNTTLYATAACGDCHDGAIQASDAGIAHRDGDLDVLGGYPLNKTKGTAYASCNTAYCHSSGQSLSNGASAVPTYATVTWGGTAACGSCHAVSGLTSGSHTAHLGATGVNGCGDCHAGAANNASSYNSIAHVDGAIDVSGSYTAGGAPGNGYGTCSTASCHDDGTGALAATPTWGMANNDCSACHATIPNTGSHAKHVTTQTVSAAIGCGDCHGTAVQGATAPAGHLDGNLDVFATAAGDLGYPQDVAKGGAPYDSCSTAYCHSDGKGAFQTVTWGVTLTGCNSCHGYPPAGGHPTSNDCVACHTNVNATNDGFVDINLHINGSVEAQGGSCSSCHGYPPAPGDGKTAQGVEGKGAHVKHVTHIAARAGVTLNADTDTFTGSTAVCGVCHDVSSDTNHSMSGGTREMLIPVSHQFGASPPSYGGVVDVSSNITPKTCSSVDCHFRETPVWAPVGGE
ncbi:MAG: CxxxxCH/CxxCH domain-containing protein [Desulfuromonadales bacterium]|nr:CxxxxCH/CxxCH domain-containing protein [Desulfuromonadales bacterium]